MNRVLKNWKNNRSPVHLCVALLWLFGVFFIIVSLNRPSAVEARAQTGSGEELFAKLCASCHQADGAGIVGTFPPLLGNPAATDSGYVASVIANGKSGPVDVLGVSYDSVMPPVPALEGADLDAVVSYVVGIAGGSEEPVDVAPVAPPAAGDADRGYDLFVGYNALDNGGAACSACHSAGSAGDLGGASLGPDLNGAFVRLGGEAGLTGWLANPPSQTMTPIFADHPMTDSEVADLVAYLAVVPTESPTGGLSGLLAAALAGLVVLLGGMAFAYRGMRQTYVQRLRSNR